MKLQDLIKGAFAFTGCIDFVTYVIELFLCIRGLEFE
jgi:hypothetical protein